MANLNHGLKEADLLKLQDALIISRIRYALPHCTLTNQHHERINTLIRKTTKFALGVPICTANTHLENTGLYVTCKEIIAAHRHNQLYGFGTPNQAGNY
ncbi:hypothetical protein HPB48_005745 [Haemaphysalis longicornis]|uniref:Uncharacterized protein n=1 Tax=Haemaphysalis longicornis TaxID=44386 RepID=A0A9J6FBH9_HAELO|nr:hypothetical protein HPB48_005745 [Haemaphysalis longicornis]